ncbi:MAG: hypothetical protein F6K47_09730 [Symploca sp. SIO2E6]|nr:hypothetical protein [Symploca sp. SIO2E6]
MAKKSLTDLLREEVEKAPPSVAATVPETTDGVNEKRVGETSEQTRGRGDAGTRRREISPKISLTPTDDELLDHDTEKVETLPMSTTKSNATGSNMTKAQLQATVTELRAALKETQDALEEAQNQQENSANLQKSLQESQQKEVSLQQEVTELRADFEQQTKSVQKLEKELKKMNQIKQELEEAKKAASQLAKTNEQLTQELNSTKQDKEDIKVPTHKPPNQSLVHHHPVRPIQKESDKPADFARNTWLL